TQKGPTAIYFENNFYRLQKQNKNGTKRWVCTNRSCSCSLLIKDERLQIVRGQHNHTNEKPSLSIIQTIDNLRQTVCSNVSKPITQIYNEILSTYRQNNGTAELVPMFDMLRSTLYRDRATVLPKLPHSLHRLILPNVFIKNLYNENMLFCDKKRPSRILGFASITAIKQLAESTIWNADGTFKTAPKLFSQSYTIHAHNEFSMKPIVFSALTNKHEKTYSSLLQSLIIYARTNNLILCPTSILIDFELSSFNAFKKAFPNANILFCHFHFAKNIMKHVKKLHLPDELQKESVKRQLANILSLPLLPINKIIAAFHDAADSLVIINRNFQTFVDYVEKTYITSPKFNPVNWNHYNTLSNRPRTNNHVEGYHRYLNSRMTAKPNIWKWIMHIQKDDEQTIIRLEQENKQNRSTKPRKKKNLMHDISLSNLKASYEQNLIDIKEYQRKIRVISYSYINALENNTTNDDND
ncbi:unnamed protein product, partial [Rotaria magnacalcarata]